MIEIARRREFDSKREMEQAHKRFVKKKHNKGIEKRINTMFFPVAGACPWTKGG